MPDPLSLLRFVALVVFIGLVAVGLWLLDVAWWVVPPVMAGALLIAWTIEWVTWRGSVNSSVAGETAAPVAAAAPPPVEEPAPFESLAPRPPVQTEPSPAPSPQPPPMPESERPTQPEPPAEPKPAPPPAPEPVPEPEPAPPPAPEPAPPPAPESAPPPPPVAIAPPPEEGAPRERRRPRRLRLRSVPAPQAEPEPVPEHEPVGPAETPSVVEFRPRTVEPRQWNLWDLERIARQEAAQHPERRDEWSYLFLNLRQFATADGSLPTEFDGLVRESFGGLLERPRGV